ncbi:MAG: hypothetical protein KGN01_07835 [Patescibacteria group bacterium]|nr:hypothetical protein [Patescibacteria group bacterium]
MQEKVKLCKKCARKVAYAFKERMKKAKMEGKKAHEWTPDEARNAALKRWSKKKENNNL